MRKTFVVKLKKSIIGCTESQIKTLRCLGLSKVNSSSEIKDSSAARGQILKVQHLVSVDVK